MKLTAYVVNLKRRPDRKEKFLKNYSGIFGIENPYIPLVISEAVDGSLSSTDFSKEPLIELVSEDTSEYSNNLRVKATILSHLQVYKKIVDNGDDYGLIFEDDINFGPYLDTFFENPKVLLELKRLKEFREPFIIYTGTGDFLPIHTNAPSESMLRAQEKAHAISIKGPNGPYKYFGVPNMKSSYVFSWLGSFSYMITKETANFLLEEAAKNPINKAIDVWLSEKNKIYVTIPLLCYHNSLQDPNYDSDVLEKKI